MSEVETITPDRGQRAGRAQWQRASEDELIVAAVENLDAFAEIIRRHQHFVYGAAMRILKNPALAEEIAQETFIRAHRSLASFRREAHVRSWLYRIATNLATNAVTRARELPAPVVPERAEHRGPARALEQKHLREDLAGAIERLPMHLREAFVMRDVEHMSYQEIADATGLGLNTVRTRILRARRSLRHELEGWR
jgi:RNA polymerase sigma-70 factor (ECF subfamily)